MSWKRARSAEQKEERRRAILEAAANIFDEGAWDGLSLNGIARRVGLAKSNLYRYFDSKEAILLDLLLSELDDWIAELEPALESALGPGPVAATIARGVAARPRMTALLALLSATLEHGLSGERLLAFKQRLAVANSRFAGALAASVPGLALADAGRALLYLHALVTGLWPMSRPPDCLSLILDKPEFQAMRIAFAPDLERSFAALLRGLSDREVVETSPVCQQPRRSP